MTPLLRPLPVRPSWCITMYYLLQIIARRLWRQPLTWRLMVRGIWNQTTTKDLNFANFKKLWIFSMHSLNDVAVVWNSSMWLRRSPPSLVGYTPTDVATLRSDVTWISLAATIAHEPLTFTSTAAVKVVTCATLIALLWSGHRDPAEGVAPAVKRTRLMTQFGVYRCDVIDQLSPVRVTTSHWPLDLLTPTDLSEADSLFHCDAYTCSGRSRGRSAI